MTSKRGQNKEVCCEPQPSNVTDVLSTFWCPLFLILYTLWDVFCQIWPQAIVGAGSFWNYQSEVKTDSPEFLMILNNQHKVNQYVTLDFFLVTLKSAVHGEAHARAERLKNKLYGSTLNSNWAYGGKIPLNLRPNFAHPLFALHFLESSFHVVNISLIFYNVESVLAAEIDISVNEWSEETSWRTGAERKNTFNTFTRLKNP